MWALALAAAGAPRQCDAWTIDDELDVCLDGLGLPAASGSRLPDTSMASCDLGGSRAMEGTRLDLHFQVGRWLAAPVTRSHSPLRFGDEFVEHVLAHRAEVAAHCEAAALAVEAFASFTHGYGNFWMAADLDAALARLWNASSPLAVASSGWPLYGIAAQGLRHRIQPGTLPSVDSRMAAPLSERAGLPVQVCADFIDDAVVWILDHERVLGDVLDRLATRAYLLFQHKPIALGVWCQTTLCLSAGVVAALVLILGAREMEARGAIVTSASSLQSIGVLLSHTVAHVPPSSLAAIAKLLDLSTLENAVELLPTSQVWGSCTVVACSELRQRDGFKLAVLRGREASSENVRLFRQGQCEAAARADLAGELQAHLATRPNDRLSVVDIGAAFGQCMLPLIWGFGSWRFRRAVAVEPSPRVREALIQTVYANGLENVVRVENVWVSSDGMPGVFQECAGGYGRWVEFLVLNALAAEPARDSAETSGSNAESVESAEAKDAADWIEQMHASNWQPQAMPQWGESNGASIRECWPFAVASMYDTLAPAWGVDLLQALSEEADGPALHIDMLLVWPGALAQAVARGEDGVRCSRHVSRPVAPPRDERLAHAFFDCFVTRP